MKKYKGQIIVSSIVILLPMLLGLILWNRLPDTMITHWGAEGTADGAMGKAFAVFLIPVICLVLHLVFLFLIFRDPRNKEQSKKMVSLFFWFGPILTLLTNGYIYAFALGSELNIAMLMVSFLGVMFILMGNYMPKCKQNSHIGYKVKWALHNEENWNRTQRFAGKAWVLGGVLFLLAMAVPGDASMLFALGSMLILGLAPLIYSYMYYRKQLKEGKITEEDVKLTRAEKTSTQTSIVITILVVVVVMLVLCSGNFKLKMEEESLQIEASWWSDAEILYGEVDRLEYVQKPTDVVRDLGFGTTKIIMGDCSSRELGKVTAYVYINCDAYITIYAGDKIMVLNQETEEETKALYEELSGKIGK